MDYTNIEQSYDMRLSTLIGALKAHALTLRTAGELDACLQGKNIWQAWCKKQYNRRLAKRVNRHR